MHGEESLAPLYLDRGAVVDGTGCCTQSSRTQPDPHSKAHTPACVAAQASGTQQTKTQTMCHFQGMLQGGPATEQALAAAAAAQGQATVPAASLQLGAAAAAKGCLKMLPIDALHIACVALPPAMCIVDALHQMPSA